MRKTRKEGFKKGAASFYVVAFSTLILVIIAASFAAIIISEITRTSNDDLAQSAYDSALAGVEDAKLAIFNYRNCLLQEGVHKVADDGDSVLTCGEILYYMEDKNDDCDMVAKILNRNITVVDEEDGDEGVVISESSTSNNMLQAYTCVKVQTALSDYRSTLSSASPTKLVPVKLEEGKKASDIKTVRISWFSDSDTALVKYMNYYNNMVLFPTLTLGASAPPTISVTMVQTASNFNLDSFDMTIDDTTNRGTIFLVPTDNSTAAATSSDNSNYLAGYKGNGLNYISQSAFLKSNDKTSKNLPYLVYCDNEGGNEFLCSATIQLPEPVGGERNDDTFLFAVSLPYGKPATSFAMEFCDSADGCVTERIEDDGSETTDSHVVSLSGVQVAVDSTGRANDLFRRVEARLEGNDTAFPYPLYAIQLLGNEGSTLLKKDLKTVCEWNFPNRGC